MRSSAVEYFIKEEIYTPLPGRVELLAQGISYNTTAQCLCKQKKPRFCGVFLNWGVMEHSENPATMLAAGTPPQL